ncbi:YwpF-like family protein [Alkalihalobacillus oceani]|uniref:YwpF-like family protein n=1 Tax=Halalkalibacter oceani TaxID=1653776 RepID=UPI002041F28D|nr:YwpF-like family protein [Halalkalibacter oceani]MCM3759552.1 YwpF-like family protein [Halalkalibacter oceani]
MKTFKLYSICLLEGKEDSVEQKKISIEDGLIINMENPEKTWYIEAVFAHTELDFFERVQREDRHMLADVVITSKENQPATMITKLKAITKLSEQISVLFEAKLAQKKGELFESVLKDLIEKGLSGEELLQEFRQQTASRIAHSQHMLDELYRSLQKNNELNW